MVQMRSTLLQVGTVSSCTYFMLFKLYGTLRVESVGIFFFTIANYFFGAYYKDFTCFCFDGHFLPHILRDFL